MRPSYVPVEAETLRRLYVDERLTAENIARQLGCTPTTVLRRLRRFAVPVRPRGSRPGAPPLSRRGLASPLGWSAEIAWAVGVVATDGNLGRDGRHLTVTSKDFDFLETIRDCLGVRARATRSRSGSGRFTFRLQWSDRELHAWLRGIGLTPAKSLTLQPLAIPDALFADFVRGCIDGDGSVTVYVDTYNTDKSERYVYERLYVSLVSASHAFLDWMQATIHRIISLNGSITVRRIEGRSPLWKLCYAKSESIELLRRLYHSPAVPCLARKRVIAEPFLRPLGHAPSRPVGRPRAGWVYNRQVPRPS